MDTGLLPSGLGGLGNSLLFDLLQIVQWNDLEILFSRNSLQNAQTTQTTPMETRVDTGFVLVWAGVLDPRPSPDHPDQRATKITSIPAKVDTHCVPMRKS